MSEKISDDRVLVSIPEACRITSLSRTKVYELLDDGALESVKIGSRRLIVRRSIDKLVETAHAAA